MPLNADNATRTGDGADMKLTAGTTQKNDSLWMYAGAPVKQWNGKLYTCASPRWCSTSVAVST